MSNKRSSLYTRKEMASILNVSVPTVDRWRKNGTIKGLQIGGTIRFTEEEVDKILESALPVEKGEKQWILNIGQQDIQIDNEDKDIFIEAADKKERYAYLKNGSLINTAEGFAIIPNPKYNDKTK